MQSFIRLLGPGILYAGAAVGVSHLVQSTSAGAQFGLSMIAIVIITHIIKFPLFDFGVRYTAHSEKSLLYAFSKFHSAWLWGFTAMTFLTMFIVLAAISSITAGTFQLLIPVEINPIYIIVGLVGAATLLLTVFNYRGLSTVLKFIVIILSVSTLVACLLSFGSTQEKEVLAMQEFAINNPAHFAFLLAFIGWMPAPFDISVWQSEWILLKKHKTDFRTTLIDFNVGYWGTAILAILFVLLGYNLLYGTVSSLPSSGKAFAELLVTMYTNSIGSYAYYIIAIAAFSTLLSTLITVLDAYPRALVQSFNFLKVVDFKPSTYNIAVISMAAGAILIVVAFGSSMLSLVKFATITSFLVAPLVAYLNIKAVRLIPNDSSHYPKKWMFYLAYFAVALLVAFSLIYLYKLAF